MSKHRLTRVMPNGLRWSQPASGVVFVAASGEIVHVARGQIGTVDRPVDTGQVWTEADQ